MMKQQTSRPTDLVTGSISQSRKERGKFTTDGRTGVVPEDDLFQGTGRSDLVGFLVNNCNEALTITSRSHLALVAHQSFGNCINLSSLALVWRVKRKEKKKKSVRGRPYRMEDHQLGNSSGSLYQISSCSPSRSSIEYLPEPSNRAVADSLLTSLAAEPAPA